ncbi:tyrosine-type recombinase/integrase [Natronolimnobius sp. AArcel1]|uniref:tyrosine-type recombinase/integrase n=1 Tax=Natronolimnobius sp. AArcel1 TaxID=1679093 RepID=UPI0013EA5F05|nr:tyrosine-type recombinase/integrase [Natronolimnobius sp. AArcel1]NGM69202.1 tyrosine-type recombinase/integrase [Natronolimnobius sp. AArcel1]
MSTDKDDLEPLDPKTAQELFLDHKATGCTESTVRNHRYRTNHFIEWCEEEGIDNLNDLSGRDIQQFRLWRKGDGELNKLTLRMQMSTLRVFLKWAGSIEAVPQDLYNKVMVPRVSPAERRNDETLDADDAQKILQYLSKYEYASIEHTLLALLWETGMRIGAVNSLDLQDVDFDEERIQLVHRQSEGTTLKNGKGGERLVAMTPALTELLREHVDANRHDVTDDYGREPLITTRHGRMARSTMRRMINRITAPCYRNESCPDCEEEVNAKCPEAVSPHAIRRGSITHFLSEDVPVEIVSDRMNVSRRILGEHYDKRSEEVKLEQRRGYLDNI